VAGGGNIARPNWSMVNGGRSTKFGGGRLSAGGGGPNGRPKAESSIHKTHCCYITKPLWSNCTALLYIHIMIAHHCYGVRFKFHYTYK